MSNIKITILSAGISGTSFVLSNDSYTLGRSDDSDICIQDSTISNHHCTLVKISDDTYAVKDEGSTNGTKLNGRKLLENLPPVAMSSGDILQVGNVEILIENCTKNAKSSNKGVSVINLDETGTVLVSQDKMKNLGDKASTKHAAEIRENKMHTAVFMGIIIVLCMAAAAGITYVLMQ